MAQFAHTDYAFLAKVGFLLGIALFVFGGSGAAVGTSVFGSIPGWIRTLFFDFEVAGILVGLLAPVGFGIFLPLVE